MDDIEAIIGFVDKEFFVSLAILPIGLLIYHQYNCVLVYTNRPAD